MKKIVILGPSGAGKTTLAQKLKFLLDIKVFHLDRHLWKQKWEIRAIHERLAIVDDLILAKGEWIIEGSYLSSSQPAVKEADTIIVLDTASFSCLFRVIMRHCSSRNQLRRDIPQGCTDRLTFSLLWKVFIFKFYGRPILMRCLPHAPVDADIIWLCSTREVQEFIVQVEQMPIAASCDDLLLIS